MKTSLDLNKVKIHRLEMWKDELLGENFKQCRTVYYTDQVAARCFVGIGYQVAGMTPTDSYSVKKFGDFYGFFSQGHPDCNPIITYGKYKRWTTFFELNDVYRLTFKQLSKILDRIILAAKKAQEIPC